MLKIENTDVCGWEHAIRGMRNPMNSWEKSDSFWNYRSCEECNGNASCIDDFHVGPNDLDLMTRLRDAGTDHRKFMRMLVVYVDITGPLYWWKEFDTYKVGTVANSCSTMHKIAAKEFTLEDFSCEHLSNFSSHPEKVLDPLSILKSTIVTLNSCRHEYLETKDEFFWWQMIQLLPSSYNQRRTVMLNYEVLANIYKSRRNHKLDEWAEHKNIDIETLKRYYAGAFKLRDEKSLADIGFCDWIKTLPYSELITGPNDKKG